MDSDTMAVSNPFERNLTVGERLAVLETKFDQLTSDHKIIQSQLDQLLELKSKGMGAFWLISLIIGGGFLGLIGVVTNFFQSKGHL